MLVMKIEKINFKLYSHKVKFWYNPPHQGLEQSRVADWAAEIFF